jgi:Beta-lactamase
MHDVLASRIEQGVAPGIVTAVSRYGEVHVDAIGMQDIAGSVPMRHNTIFRAASITKPFAAVAAMILVEKCRLRLDEPVDRLLPELAGRKVLKRLDGPVDDTVLAHRPITLRDLLTMRMGLGMVVEPSGVLSRVLGPARLGLWRVDGDLAQRHRSCVRPLCLGWRLRHLLVLRSSRGHGGRPHGAAPVRCGGGRPACRLLDARLPGDR